MKDKASMDALVNSFGWVFHAENESIWFLQIRADDGRRMCRRARGYFIERRHYIEVGKSWKLVIRTGDAARKKCRREGCLSRGTSPGFGMYPAIFDMCS